MGRMLTKLQWIGGCIVGGATVISSVASLLPLFERERPPGFFGFQAEQINERIAKATSLASTEGAFVTYVYSGYPADLAGLLPGDIVLALNGTEIGNAAILLARLSELRANEDVTLMINRRGGLLLLRGSMGDRPKDNELAVLNKTLIPTGPLASKEPVGPEDYAFARVHPLEFYPEAELVEFGNYISTCMTTYLFLGDSAPIRMTGKSQDIHDINKLIGLSLEASTEVVEYLRFFSGHVWAEEGPFRVVENASTVWPTKIPASQKIAPLTVRGGPSDYEVHATVLYGSSLHESTFSVTSAGGVKMPYSVVSTAIRQSMTFDDGHRCAENESLVEKGGYPVGPSMDGVWTNADWRDFLAYRQMVLGTPKF
jgi:hypothetical protein